MAKNTPKKIPPPEPNWLEESEQKSLLWPVIFVTLALLALGWLWLHAGGN